MVKQIQQVIDELNEKFQRHELSEGELYHATALMDLHLDHSDKSLERLSTLLSSFSEQAISFELLTQSAPGQLFLLLISNYLCQCINQRTGTQTEWTTSPQVQQTEEIPFFISSTTDLIAHINDIQCLPLEPIYQHIQQQASDSLVDYVDHYCGALTQLDHTNTDQVYRQFLNALLKSNYLPEGNAFRRLTNLMQFDGSMRSLEEIDCLLLTIKELKGLSPNQQTEFLAEPAQANFVLALNFYLGYVISVHGRSSLHWLNQTEYLKLHSHQKAQDNNRYVAMLDQQVIQPLAIILELLFSPHTHATCTEFVQKWIHQTSAELHIFPSSLRIEQHEELPAQLEHSFKHAGKFSAELSNRIMQQQDFEALLYINEDELNYQIVADTAEARSQINAQQPFFLSATHSDIDLPWGREKAIHILIHIQAPFHFTISLKTPYRPTDDQNAFKIYSTIRDQHNDLTLSEMNAGMARYYQEAFRFFDEGTNRSLWGKYYQDLAWPKVLHQNTSGESLYELRKMFQSFFNHQEKQPDVHIPQSTATQIDAVQPVEPDFVLAEDQAISSPAIQPYKIHKTQQQNINPFAKINIQQEIEHLPANYLSYLQVNPPLWLAEDSLKLQLQALPSLYHTGKSVWGSKISDVYRADREIDEQCVVHFVYDPTGQTSKEALEHVADLLANLKLSDDMPQDQKDIYNQLQKTDCRFHKVPVPASLSEAALWISSSWIWPAHLPDGRFSLSSCPIMVCDDPRYQTSVMPLPSWFWPKDLRAAWLNQSLQMTGEQLDLNPKFFKNLELFQSIDPSFDVLALRPPLEAIIDKNPLDFDLNQLLLNEKKPKHIEMTPAVKWMLGIIGIILFIGLMLL